MNPHLIPIRNYDCYYIHTRLTSLSHDQYSALNNILGKPFKSIGLC